jgi:hypothetical protein
MLSFPARLASWAVTVRMEAVAVEGAVGAVARPGDGASPAGAAEAAAVAAAVAAATETTASDGTRYPHQVPTSSPPDLYLSICTGIFKLLRRPGIDSKESIPAAFVACWTGTQPYYYFIPSPHRLFPKSSTGTVTFL